MKRVAEAQLRAAIRPKVDKLVDEVVARLLKQTEAAWNIASKAAIAKLTEHLEGKPDVEDTKPVRDRTKDRAAVSQRRRGRIAAAARSRVDRDDRAPAVAAKVVRASSSSPASSAATPAVKGERRPKTCSICGAVGFTKSGCGKTHNVGVSLPEGLDRQMDVRPSSAPVQAPPPPSRTGSRESRPLPARAAKEPSGDDDEEGRGVELFMSESNGPTRPPRRRYKSRRQRGHARAFVVRERTGEDRANERLRLTLADIAGSDELAELETLRPRTREECRDAVRPCPWVGCKHHLYLDVVPHTGSLKINFPGLEPTDLAETCALDVAERGALTLEEVGELTNLTRERIRQVETRGLLTLKTAAAERGIEAKDSHFPHPKED